MATGTVTPRNSPAMLWQYPIFLLGIASVVGVWYARPYWQPSPSERYQRELTALRQAVDKTPPDPTEVQTLLRKLETLEPPADLLGQVQYQMGSAEIVLAESAANADEAEEHWRIARRHLEACAQAIPEPDQLRYRFRLSKTWAGTGVEPEKVVDALTKSMKAADDPAEGHRLLGETYLRYSPPLKQKAREAFKECLARTRTGIPEGSTRTLNQTRLKLGELHFEMGDPEEARKVLERIGSDAPTELQYTAKVLMATNRQKESQWSEAVVLWEQARDLKSITPVQKGRVLLQLAECYLKLDRREQATEVLAQLRRSKGPEAAAASLKWAQVTLSDANRKEEVLGLLESALNRVESPEQYANPLMPLKEARAVYEQAVRTYQSIGHYDHAVRVAAAYSPIAEKGRDRELIAQAWEAWGQGLLQSMDELEPPEQPRTLQAAHKRLRDAAHEWQQVGVLKASATERGDAIRRAASLYQKIGDLPESLKLLDEFGFKAADYPEERLPEIWLQKGELYLAMENREQARICFQNAVQLGDQFPGPTIHQSRVRLTELQIYAKDMKAMPRATAELEKILDDTKVQQNKDLHETILSLLGDALYTQKEYAKAETRYRSALDHYPEGSRAIHARFYLGLCYWRQAGIEADKCKVADQQLADPTLAPLKKQEIEKQREGWYKRYMDLLKKAAEPMKSLESQFAKRAKSGPRLSRDEADYQRRAALCAADCSFFLGDYDDCLVRYEQITLRYAGTVVQLEAYRALIECHRHLKNPDKVADRLTQMRTAYGQMPETAFDGTAEVKTREYWTQWFEKHDKP